MSADWKAERTPLLILAAVFAACYALPTDSARFEGAVMEGLRLVKWYAQEHMALCVVPALSQFLQGGLNLVLGPILIVVGMLLTGLLEVPWSLSLAGDGMQERVGAGWWWPLLLGGLFALSFCPVSAALFFGSLVPLAVRAESPLAVPLAYGVATAVPVVAVACVLAFSAGAVGRTYNAMQRFAWWAQRITGGVFILAGIYLSLIYIFRVPLL